MQIVKVFKSGNSQAVRIPKEFSIEEKELYIQKIGNTLVLTSMKDSWSSLRKSLTMFSEDVFSNGKEQPKNQEREDI